MAAPQSLRQPLAYDRRRIGERMEHGGPEDALTQPRRAAVDWDDPPDVKRLLAIIDELELRRRHLNLTGPASDAPVQDDRAAAREMAGKVGLIVPDGVQHPRAVGDRGPRDDQPSAPARPELADGADRPLDGLHRPVLKLILGVGE